MNTAVKAAPAKRAAIEYNTVTMDDGRVVEFSGKKRMRKEVILHKEAAPQVRMDFSNGETRIFTVDGDLFERFAAHGASQKLGDEISGLDDVEDCLMAVDAMMDRLNGGEWGATRAASDGLAGSSVLARAMCEASGKSMVDVRAFLATKTQAQKIALRNLPTINPIILKLEANKVRKVKDTGEAEALLDGFIGA